MMTFRGYRAVYAVYDNIMINNIDSCNTGSRGKLAIISNYPKTMNSDIFPV